MIRIEKIFKSFGYHQALKHVTLDVKEGEFLVLLGPSGSGKSTLLKLINRLIDSDSGDIFINDENIKSLNPVMLRRSIGYVIQNTGLFPHYTVKENISAVPKLLNWEEDKIDKRVKELIELAGIKEEYLDKKPRQLSGGEAQRVGVLRALAANPKILLMDEPFGAVDPIIRQKLQVEFSKIQKKLNITVIFVTHDVNEAVLLADRIALLNKGELITVDRPFNLIYTNDEFVKDFIGESYTIDYLSKLKAKDYIDNYEGENTLKEYLSNLIKYNDDGIKDFHVIMSKIAGEKDVRKKNV